jgi:RNA polymerase sigma-70 factor (ECF subfamily)
MELGSMDTDNVATGSTMPESQALRDVFVSHVEGSIDRLYGTAMRLTRNPSDAEELVAETVAKAWACLHTLQDPDRCLPWMLRIMTNMFISEKRTVRSRTPHEEYLEEPDAEDTGFSLFDRLHQPFLLWWGNPEQEFLDRVAKTDIEAALEALPENFRIVVLLSDMEGLTYQEIAEALDVPIGTVRSRLARARGLLQKALWDHALDKGLVSGPQPS